MEAGCVLAGIAEVKDRSCFETGLFLEGRGLVRERKLDPILGG